MKSIEQQIEELVAELGGPNQDGAECTLVELGKPAIAMLIAAYARERDPSRRASIVYVLWQSREVSVMPMLAKALLDVDGKVWKQALDGIVTFGGSAAINVLSAARDSAAHLPDGSTRREWIEEAIAQVRESMSE